MGRLIAGGLPGVFMREVDLSETMSPVGSNDGAIMLSGRSGPVNQRLLIRSASELDQVLGVPFPEDDISITAGYYGAVEALKQSNMLTVVRVSDGNERYANVNIGNETIKADGASAIDFSPNPNEIQRKQASEAVYNAVTQEAWNDGIPAMDTAEAVSRCPEGFTFSTTKGKPGILDVMESEKVVPGTLLLASIAPDAYGNDLAVSVATPPGLVDDSDYDDEVAKALSPAEFSVLNFYISQTNGRFLESSVYFGDKPSFLNEGTTESFADAKSPPGSGSLTPRAEWIPGKSGFDWFWQYDSRPVVPTDSDSPLIDIYNCRDSATGGIQAGKKAGRDYPAYDVPRDAKGRSTAVWSKLIKIGIYRKPSKSDITYWEPLNNEIAVRSTPSSASSYVMGVDAYGNDLVMGLSDGDVPLRVSGWKSLSDFEAGIGHDDNFSFPAEMKTLWESDDPGSPDPSNGYSILRWRSPVWTQNASGKWVADGVATGMNVIDGRPEWDGTQWVSGSATFSAIGEFVAVLRTEIPGQNASPTPVRSNYKLARRTNAIPYLAQAYWDRITPEEEFVVSLGRISDEGGNSLYIEDVVNGSSSLVVANAKHAGIAQVTRSTPMVIPFFGGFSPENYIVSKLYALKAQATELFSNRKTSRFGLFYVCEAPSRATMGTYSAYAKAVSDLCSNELKRGDAMVIQQVSCTDSGTENKIYDDVMAMHGTNTPSYTAGYAGYVYMADTKLRREVLVPAVNAGISALLAGEKPWSAPMGVNRGVVPWSLGVWPRLGDEAWGRLYDVNANAVVNEPPYGDCVWGQKTMQIKTTALSRINVRRVVLHIKRNIRPFLIPWLGEQYDDRMHNSISTTLKQFMDGLAIEGAIYSDASVIIDASDDLIANNQLNIIISFVPRYVIEKIQVTTAIMKVGMSPSSITFEEAYS